MHSSRMHTGRLLTVFRRLLLGGVYVWCGGYLVPGGVVPGGYLVRGCGLGGCTWSRGYLVRGGVVWGGTWSWGVPGPGGYLVQGGVVWRVYLVRGGTWSRGGAPGPRGCAWSGTPPCEQNDRQV